MAVDCHIHMALDGGYWKDALARHKEAPDEQFIRKTLETYKRLGFTYLRDGGDRWEAGKRASELAPEYGIRYRTPVFPIYRTSLLVMGTSFPGSKLRKNASSGRPGVTISPGVSFSISAALSLSNVWERSSCAVPRVIASSG